MTVSERYIDEGVDAHNQNEDLGNAGDVVVQEASAVSVREGGVICAVATLWEGAFQDILFHQKEDDEDYGEDEPRVGCKFGERRERRMFDVLVARDIDVDRHVGDMVCRKRVWIEGLGSWKMQDGR